MTTIEVATLDDLPALEDISSNSVATSNSSVDVRPTTSDDRGDC